MIKIVFVSIAAFIVLVFVRAKFSKKLYSSKKFYLTLLTGFILITMVGSMWLGYRAYGNSEFMHTNIAFQNNLIMFMCLPILYSMLMAILFNLNSLKENIMKILIVVCLIPLCIPLSSLGLFFSIMACVGNPIVIILTSIIEIILIFLLFNKKLENKLLLEIFVALLGVLIIIFSSDMFFQLKYIENGEEIWNTEQIRQELA